MKIKLFVETLDKGSKRIGHRFFDEKEFEFTKNDLKSIIECYENESDWKINGKYPIGELGAKFEFDSMVSIINVKNKQVLKFNYNKDWSNLRYSLSISYEIKDENFSRIESALQKLNPDFEGEGEAPKCKK